MADRDIALEALCTLCNGSVTSVQRQASPAVVTRAAGAAPPKQLFIKHFISAILDADETSLVSRSHFARFQRTWQNDDLAGGFITEDIKEVATEQNHIIDEDEFFDPQFDYDFSNLRDTETYRRGGEVYERPCGWKRFALRVLNEYDGNTWLGTRFRSTSSVPGEWPVSYHGTSQSGAEGIIGGHYLPGPGQAYGRGIYSTPYISEAVYYAKQFISKKNGKTYKVILQNRINPEYREKHYSGKYWLVRIPKGTSAAEEQNMVERAIRPYGLLLKEF